VREILTTDDRESRSGEVSVRNDNGCFAFAMYIRFPHLVQQLEEVLI